MLTNVKGMVNHMVAKKNYIQWSLSGETLNVDVTYLYLLCTMNI